MNHLMNFLAGLGSSLGAFGSAPAYRYPKRGDRAQDTRALSGDMRRVGQNLRATTEKAIQETHGKINNRPTQG